MGRRWKLGAVGVFAVAAGVVVVLLMRGQSTAPAMPAVVAAPEMAAGSGIDGEWHGADPGEQGNIRDVTALLSGLPTAFARGDADGVVVEGPVAGVDVRMAFRPGATVTVEAESWNRVGPVGSVLVEVRDPVATQRHLAIVFRQPAGWRLSETYPAGEQ